MDGKGKHIKFFRVRSPYYVTGSSIEVLWLFDSFQYIDFSENIFVQEAIAVAQLTYGSIGFSELKNMDFKMYEKIIEQCVKINKNNQNVETNYSNEEYNGSIGRDTDF